MNLAEACEPPSEAVALRRFAAAGEVVARRMDRECRKLRKFYAELMAAPEAHQGAAIEAAVTEMRRIARLGGAKAKAFAAQGDQVMRRLALEALRDLTRRVQPVPPRALRSAPRRREHRAAKSSGGTAGDDGPEPPAAERLLRVAEVAALLAVSRKTVHYWITENLLPARRLPSSGDRPLLRIPAAAVDRFAAGFQLHARRPRPHRVPEARRDPPRRAAPVRAADAAAVDPANLPAGRSGARPPSRRTMSAAAIPLGCPDPAEIPADLRQLERWLTFVVAADPARPGKLSKRPYNGASCTDPATWCGFDFALGNLEYGRGNALGFALGDGIAGVDLDDVRDPRRARSPRTGGDPERLPEPTPSARPLAGASSCSAGIRAPRAPAGKRRSLPAARSSCTPATGCSS